MPKVSRNTVSHSVDLQGLDVQLGHLEGGYSFEAGDAYYVPPGHIPAHYAGTEIVEFSPTDVLEKTIKVVMSNLQRVGAS
jgi:hypothetical protein